MISLTLYFATSLVVQRCPPPLLLAREVKMPAILSEWGCDDALWQKVRAKEALIRLADAGDETAARERIAMLRNSPSILGAELPMPEILVACGGDAELWLKVKSKKAVTELCAGGDEEAVRARVASLRVSIAAEEARESETSARRKAKKDAKPSKWAKKFKLREAGLLEEKPARPRRNEGRAKPLSDGYSLAGSLPDSIDVAAVEGLLARRIAAKKQQNYDEADALQKEILKMGVGVNDRRRTFFDASSGWSYKS